MNRFVNSFHFAVIYIAGDLIETLQAMKVDESSWAISSSCFSFFDERKQRLLCLCKKDMK